MMLDTSLRTIFDRPSRINIQGVVTNGRGEPLRRTVMLYDGLNNVVDIQNSDEEGRVSFTLSGYTINDQFTAVGAGHRTENPGISVVCRGIAVWS